MFRGRFGHVVKKFGKYIYAIGGNYYGADQESCLTFVERF